MLDELALVVTTKNIHDTVAIDLPPTLSEDDPTVRVPRRRASERQHHVTIRVVSGSDIFKVCVVYLNDRVVIGRAKACDLSLRDTSVSREHASVTVLEEGVLVEDLASINGTLCRGVELTGPTTVEIGSEVEVGGVTVRIERLTMDELMRLAQLRVRLQEAHEDALCGVYSRRHLDEVLPEQLRGYSQAQIPVAACLFDLDDFAQINDAHGREIGDAVLRELAQRLRRGVRSSDAVVRYGGDEFLLILPHCDESGAARLAERLCASVAEIDWSSAVGSNLASLRLTMSAAVSQYDGEDLVDWLEATARALADAKAVGSNTVVKPS